MTPGQAVLKLKQISEKLKKEVRQAESANLRSAKRIAVLYSSGTFTSIRLARMGYPYSTRHPNPPADPAIINRQTGLFRASWHTRLGSWRGNQIVSTLINTAPYAGYLDKGTRRMIARPIREAILDALEKERTDRLKMAVQKALKP